MDSTLRRVVDKRREGRALHLWRVDCASAVCAAAPVAGVGCR
jgi:hypothetical protein